MPNTLILRSSSLSGSAWLSFFNSTAPSATTSSTMSLPAAIKVGISSYSDLKYSVSSCAAFSSVIISNVGVPKASLITSTFSMAITEPV